MNSRPTFYSTVFRLPALCILAVALAGITACSSTDQARSDTPPGTTEQEPTSSNASGQQATPQSDAQAEAETLYWQRVRESRMNFTEADVHFMTGMIAHHAQALVMSRLAPQNGASQQIQTLAARIINAQQDEIAAMQRWLEDRDLPVPEYHIEGLNLMIHMDGEHMTHHMDMPGVLTQQQLNQLGEAQGREFDRLFLFYMIEHHGGAVTMVENLISEDGAAQDVEAYRLASGIHVDQITEIERMTLMLAQMAGAG